MFSDLSSSQLDDSQLILYEFLEPKEIICDWLEYFWFMLYLTLVDLEWYVRKKTCINDPAPKPGENTSSASIGCFLERWRSPFKVVSEEA